MNISNSPTNVKVYPIPGIGVEVKATFHQANSLSATYARFQVSTSQDFATTFYDSDQVSIIEIPDGTEGTMVLNSFLQAQELITVVFVSGTIQIM